MENAQPKIAQIGIGNFGKRHLEAWKQLGWIERLWVVEQDHAKWAQAQALGVSKEHLASSLDAVVDQVSAVDIVTPTDTHTALIRKALEAGKDVFVEKPMTANSEDARQLAALAKRSQRLIQVGYYYRSHPAARALKEQIREGRLGKIRYVTGNFCGFKRARNDVGVTHTDGIHFLDLFSWLLDTVPADVFAVCRDHFGRGLEDFSVVLLNYPQGTAGKVESGYIQPGRWKDPVVAGAMTTKDITVMGERGCVEIDFEKGDSTFTEIHHENKSGTWTPVFGKTNKTSGGSFAPSELIALELQSFLKSVESREPTIAGPTECGIHLAVLMEALYDSARRRELVRVESKAMAGAST